MSKLNIPSLLLKHAPQISQQQPHNAFEIAQHQQGSAVTRTPVCEFYYSPAAVGAVADNAAACDVDMC
jgi:hypothetical protein